MQLSHFDAVELAVGPGIEVGELQWPKSDPFEIEHFVADTGEEPADFAVLTFGEDNLEDRALTLPTESPNVPHAELPFGEVVALFELVEDFPGGVAGNLHAVDPFDLKSRMRQSLGNFAIVGEKEQTLGILVQTTHGKYPARLWREQIDRTRSAGGIVVCAEIALGLVDQEVLLPLRLDLLAVEADSLPVGINLKAKLCHDFAVDGDSPGGDQFFAVAPRVDPGRCENFLQSFETRCGVLASRFVGGR